MFRLRSRHHRFLFKQTALLKCSYHSTAFLVREEPQIQTFGSCAWREVTIWYVMTTPRSKRHSGRWRCTRSNCKTIVGWKAKKHGEDFPVVHLSMQLSIFLHLRALCVWSSINTGRSSGKQRAEANRIPKPVTGCFSMNLNLLLWGRYLSLRDRGRASSQ